MARTNVIERLEKIEKSSRFTHERAPEAEITPEQQLRRSLMACMLYEEEFYESGVEIAKRISVLVPQVPAEIVSNIAIECREKMKLRHAPLLVVREMAKHSSHKALVATTLERVIQRVDEIAEFLSLYSQGRTDIKKLGKLSNQARKGIAASFHKFNEYQFAKYDRKGAVTLRDALFISHAKPVGEEETALFKAIAEGTLKTPDTWEVALSGGSDKKETFTRLIEEKKLGGLALLRNLRNIKESGIDKKFAEAALLEMKTDRILPFRYIAAARAVPEWEGIIARPMMDCLAEMKPLRGKTAILVDNSGSMGDAISSKSDLKRVDAACALAILVREIADQVLVIGFGTEAKVIAPRHGFALADAIRNGPGGGTYIQTAVDLANSDGYDRIIIITDEQSHQKLEAPRGRGYIINVASAKNGVGYGEWLHMDGWSESVLGYIQEFEASQHVDIGLT